jgi:hemoglobin
MKIRIHFENFKNLSAALATEFLRVSGLLVVVAALAATVGCGTAQEKKQDNFFTSGNRAADQRASQRMAKAEQLSGSGEGAGEKKSKSDAVEAERKLSLYERLGSDSGIMKIVEDFLSRALQDPRVNWQRQGIKHGGFSLQRNQPVTWKASPENVAAIKKHIAQFFALATGGPARYEGKEMKSAHANMHITNAEFDAAVGDLKASLDKMQIQNREQKELLAIVESTRPQIVAER